MTTVHTGDSVEQDLAQAQRELDQHLAVNRAGRCTTCGENEPCPGRLAASAIFAMHRRLPARVPGLASAGFR